MGCQTPFLPVLVEGASRRCEASDGRAAAFESAIIQKWVTLRSTRSTFVLCSALQPAIRSLDLVAHVILAAAAGAVHLDDATDEATRHARQLLAIELGDLVFQLLRNTPR